MPSRKMAEIPKPLTTTAAETLPKDLERSRRRTRQSTNVYFNMQPTVTKRTTKEMAEILESDDELPDSYDESPDIPAYQDNNRFDRLEPIKFEWLHQKHDNTSSPSELSQQKTMREDSNSCSIGTIMDEQQLFQCNKSFSEQKTDTEILISKGTLSKRDIFFIKSIEEYCTHTTLLWFIDFLNYKAAQQFHRSCLVADYQCTPSKELASNFNTRCYFKWVFNN